VRPDVAEETHQGRRRNNPVEEPLEITSVQLVGFVESLFQLSIGTTRRFRRSGTQGGATIWHADRIATPRRVENTGCRPDGRSIAYLCRPWAQVMPGRNDVNLTFRRIES